MTDRIEIFIRDGVRLNVDDTGGDGKAIVFQHGLGGAAGQPAEIFPQESGLRRLTLECRGHGLSEAGDPDALSISTFADDVAALVEDCGAAPVIVAGISMGAAIALRLAVRRPDLVRALILVRPAWLIEPNPTNLAPIVEVGRLLAAMPPHEAKAIFLGGDMAGRLAAEAPDNLVSLSGFFDRAEPAVIAALLQQIPAGGPDVSEAEIRALRVPTLVIGNLRDFIHPIAYATDLARMIADARFVEVTAKADAHDRYVADCRAALASFLKDLS